MTDLSYDFGSGASATATEAQYPLTELFFTRTDKRGVIKAANAGFQGISGFDWSDILGAPQNIVRHPTIPKGVFYLYWTRLQAGQPVGAYIKNKTKSGRYYWVFALAMPEDGGYLSIGIKPTSETLERVSELYETLLDKEQSEGLSPEDSAAWLLKSLKGVGYENYDNFQATALATEQKARADHLRLPLIPLQKRFMEMSHAIHEVQKEITDLTEAFQSIRTVPMNMRIIASRLGNAGGPISAISVNYSQMLEDMSTWVQTFVEGEECVFARIRNAILNSQFLGFTSDVQEGTIARIEAGLDDYPDELDMNAEIARIQDCRARNIAETSEALGMVEQEARRFGRSVLDMKRYVTGLSSTRMMCKIESASLHDKGADLSGVVDQLDAGQDEIEIRLARVVELNAVIQTRVSTLRSLL